MGFFSDLKDDLSQAVNELLPDDKFFATLGEGEELEEATEELLEEGVENPTKTLCEEFCNFPEDSIRQIICSDNEILEFEW
jgi:hypothetical protein